MIYTFHKVAPERKNGWYVTPKFFEKFLLEHPDDLMTFDGVYECTYKYALPIMRHHKRKGVWFFMGGFVGRDNSFDRGQPLEKYCDYWELFDIAVDQELGWHTWLHQDLTKLGENGIEKEVKPPFRMKSFAYPYNKFNELSVAYARKYFDRAMAGEDGNDTDWKLKRINVFQDDSNLSVDL